MAYGQNFVDRLAQARRRGTVSGRPLSSREVYAISAGEASIANEQSIRIAQIEEAKRANQEAEALAREKFAEEQRIRREQEETQKRNTVLSGAAAGAQVGSNFGPWGTIIGGVAGAGMGWVATANGDQKRDALSFLTGGGGGLWFAQNNSTFCTKINTVYPLPWVDRARLILLMRYVQICHKPMLEQYQKIAPYITINAEDLNYRLIDPVCALVGKSKFEAAYSIYKGIFKALALKQKLWDEEAQNAYVNG